MPRKPLRQRSSPHTQGGAPLARLSCHPGSVLSPLLPNPPAYTPTPVALMLGPNRRPCNFLVRNHWDNEPRLKQLKTLPTLFLSALQARALFYVCCLLVVCHTCCQHLRCGSCTIPSPRHADSMCFVSPAVQQDEMLPAPQMRQLYELHPREPWRIIYFPGGPPSCTASASLVLILSVAWCRNGVLCRSPGALSTSRSEVRRWLLSAADAALHEGLLLLAALLVGVPEFSWLPAPPPLFSLPVTLRENRAASVAEHHVHPACRGAAPGCLRLVCSAVLAGSAGGAARQQAAAWRQRVAQPVRRLWLLTWSTPPHLLHCCHLFPHVPSAGVHCQPGASRAAAGATGCGAAGGGTAGGGSGQRSSGGRRRGGGRGGGPAAAAGGGRDGACGTSGQHAARLTEAGCAHMWPGMCILLAF